MISSNTRTILILAVGILLVTVASMNINISSPPANLNEIPNNYGKTYCLKVQTKTDENDQITVANNAFVLMLSSLISGLLLILLVLPDLFKMLTVIYNRKK